MQRLRRKLEPYQEQLFKADYASTIPPQWLSWLRRTRVTAPTLEELVSDQLRQERIKILAQAASDKWYLEKQRMEEEHQLKLKEELQRAKQPVQASANEDPWAAADKKNPVVEEASINPRR
ncbi:NADH dehydrogenase [ubiquinone] 1 alpha subcomplex subunit [[Candida] zeylanoides]